MFFVVETEAHLVQLGFDKACVAPTELRKNNWKNYEGGRLPRASALG